MNEIMTLQLAEYKDLDLTKEDIGDLEWDDEDEKDFSNYRDGQVVSARLMQKISEGNHDTPFTYSVEEHYPGPQLESFYGGIHIDKLPNESYQAAQFCKDIGAKESF